MAFFVNSGRSTSQGRDPDPVVDLLSSEGEKSRGAVSQQFWHGDDATSNSDIGPIR
jgi:hypothetical protein